MKKPKRMTGKTMKTYITPNKKFFNWIYNRLVYVHGENPNYDYMLSLRERIDDLFGNEEDENEELYNNISSPQ